MWLQALFTIPIVLLQVVNGQEEDKDSRPSSLFTVAPESQVIGPTSFRKPSLLVSKNAVIAVKPAFGEHRPDQDAVFAYAEGQCRFYVLAC